MSDLQPTTKVEIIETELRSISDARGTLVPTEIVDIAADTTQPLHPILEWDDTEAARRFRIGQAGAMIRSVKIQVTTAKNGDVEDFKIRAWVSAKAAGTGAGYVPEAVVREHPDMRDRVLRQMMRELNAFRRRYGHYAEFWAAVQQMGDEAEAS